MFFFKFSAYQPSQPECRVDSDCPPQKACLDQVCQNPCSTRNPCRNDLVCSVAETSSGKKTVACSCPAGFILAEAGACRPGTSTFLNLCCWVAPRDLSTPPSVPVIASSECTTDNDCEDSEVCELGSCQDACHVRQCGSKAICSAEYHSRTCRCPPKHVGDPTVACTPSKFGLALTHIWQILPPLMHVNFSYTWLCPFGGCWLWGQVRLSRL